jgi:hypothetical protein
MQKPVSDPLFGYAQNENVSFELRSVLLLYVIPRTANATASRDAVDKLAVANSLVADRLWRNVVG